MKGMCTSVSAPLGIYHLSDTFATILLFTFKLIKEIMPKRKNNITKAAAIPDDFSKLTVALLKEECAQRNLEISGRKADLVQRLLLLIGFFAVHFTVARSIVYCVNLSALLTTYCKCFFL